MLNFNSFQEFIDAVQGRIQQEPAGDFGRSTGNTAGGVFGGRSGKSQKRRGRGRLVKRNGKKQRPSLPINRQRLKRKPEKTAIRKRVDALIENKKISPAYGEQELMPILMAADTGAEIEFGPGRKQAERNAGGRHVVSVGAATGKPAFLPRSRWRAGRRPSSPKRKTIGKSGRR